MVDIVTEDNPNGKVRAKLRITIFLMVKPLMTLFSFKNSYFMNNNLIIKNILIYWIYLDKFSTPSPIFSIKFLAPSVRLAPRSVAFFCNGTTFPVSLEEGFINVWFVSFTIFFSIWFVPWDNANGKIVNVVRISINIRHPVVVNATGNDLFYINLSFSKILSI